MKSLSENIPVMNTKKKNAFTLVEVTAALVILALISGSVLVVIDRCLSSTADLTSRMQAFEVARENMENLLSQDSVKEKVDYGTSDKYPNIDWETNVGTFSEPLTSEMWVRAVCSAQYTDIQGKQQTVELTHWLTSVSKSQMLEILKEVDKRKKMLKKQLIDTIQQAAEYADVDIETIQQWIGNDMPRTNSGAFIKDMLDLYKKTDGHPTNKQIKQRQQTYQVIANSLGKEITAEPAASESPAPSQASKPTQTNSEKTYFGYTESELRKLSFAEIIKLLQSGSAD